LPFSERQVSYLPVPGRARKSQDELPHTGIPRGFARHVVASQQIGLTSEILVIIIVTLDETQYH